MTATQPPLPELSGVTHRYVDVDGLRVHVAEAGSGPPVVLLHGWPQHWWAWRDVIPALAAERRVICPDLRGMGWTDAPATGYDKRQLATDLVGLLDALELERVAIVGHDWGAWTALVAAAREPARFSAVLALAIPHPWVPVTRPDLGAIGRSLLILGYQGPLSTPGLGPLLVRSGVVRLIMRLGRGDGRFTADEVRAFDATYRVPARARATSALYRRFLTRELPAMARDRYEPGRVEVPVQLVVGAKDRITGGPLEEHGGHLPHLTVEHVPGAGHFLPEERPQLVIERALALPTP